MPVRGSHRRARLVGLNRRPVLLGLLVLVLCAACAGSDLGRYHTVRRGENLYRIGLRYGVPASEIARANRIRDVTAISVGTKLWIPRPKGGGRRSASAPPPARTHPQREVRRPHDLGFIWPIRGQITSRFGRRSGRMHEGIDVAARKGTVIRAAESGKVIHSGRLGGYGNVVIIKHQGSYKSVYAHASRLYVRKGQFVERGQKIAAVGSTGRATGPHLHFEIRSGETPRNPVLYLP
ncbi:MAG: M23 family metallopeptidase [Myxococcota bacterium]